jgi:internalin A
MRDVWLPFPTRWREIKDAISGMRDNYLTYVEYAHLCESKGETDPGAQARLANYLNTLGLAIYFGTNPQLHDTRVLNPAWVTGGVYAVIRSSTVAARDGQLAVNDMMEVLRQAEEQLLIKSSDYPPRTHAFILELMRAYGLCYANDDAAIEGGAAGELTRYLVPELLPEYEPEMNDKWDLSPLRLRYRYEVLPPGFVPRFIVHTHALSEGAPHWRHGVVLRHAESSALVRAESDRPELYVFVLGGTDDTRRVLVTMIRRELDVLHAEFKVSPVEELELSGDAQQWISVKALKEVERPDVPRVVLAVQPDGTAVVDVGRELDKLIPSKARAANQDPKTVVVPVSIFVSYAHDDERQLKRLDCVLDVLEQQQEVSPWIDKRLVTGEEWDAVIRKRLDEMDIFVFVASQASLVRAYIRDPELRRARERSTKKEVEVATIKLEPCACDDDPFLGKMQRLAPKFKSIAQTSPRSLAWEQVRRDLLMVINRVRRKKEKRDRE